MSDFSHIPAKHNIHSQDDLIRFNQTSKNGCYCPKCHIYIPKRKNCNYSGIKYIIQCLQCATEYVVAYPEYLDYLVRKQR